MAIEDAVLARCLRDLPDTGQAFRRLRAAQPGWNASSPTGRGRATARPPVPSPGYCAT